MKRTVFVMLAVLLSTAFAQQMWERTYGGAGDDYGYSVQQTTDSGYIVAGYTSSFGNSNQVYLIKTNASGDTLWTRTCGGTGNDQGNSVQQTLDGGYIVAGTTASFGDYSRVYLLKTDTSGETLWTRTYGGEAPWSAGHGNCVKQTTDSGYIIAGSCGRNDYLVKTSANGDTVWTRRHFGGRHSSGGGHSVLPTADRGYIVAGGIYEDFFGEAGLLYKASASGDTVWVRAYPDVIDWCFSVQHTFDGHYVVAGYDGYLGVLLAKVDTTGDALWTQTYSGTWEDRGGSAQPVADSGYIVAGYTSSFGDSNQVYLIRTNSSGDTLWTRAYGGTGDDRGYSVQQTQDGGFIVAGYTNSHGNGTQVYLLKTDAEGNCVGIDETPHCPTGAAVANAATVLHRLPTGAVAFDAMGRRAVNPKPGVYFVREQSAVSSQHTATIIRKVLIAD